MKKNICTFVFLASSTFALAGEGLNRVTLLEDKELEQSLKQAYAKGIIINTGTGGAPPKLVSDTFVFETPESKSDFKIEIHGSETASAIRVSLRSIVKEDSVHEIDKLAVMKEEVTISELSMLRMKNGTVKFFAEKSHSQADYSKLECKGCQSMWAGHRVENSVKTPRLSGSGLPNGSSEQGTGLATGRAKVVLDRETGRSKGFSVSKTNQELIDTWLKLFQDKSDKEIVIEFDGVNSGLIDELLAAKSVKLIVPIAMEKEVRVVTMGYAIKEQGVKLQIHNGGITAIMQVNEARPMEPR